MEQVQARTQQHSSTILIVLTARSIAAIRSSRFPRADTYTQCEGNHRSSSALKTMGQHEENLGWLVLSEFYEQDSRPDE